MISFTGFAFFTVKNNTHKRGLIFMITNETIQFLQDIKKNNNREWFTYNKKRYEIARSEFESFISDLMMQIAQFDPEIAGLDPKRCIFRIYRDTRFSRDKRPYKTNFGAHLALFSAKPHDRAGYYVHIEPANSFLAGGAYMPPAPWLKAIRAAIDQNGQKLINIINDPLFRKFFVEMQGEKLKTTPKDYSTDHPYIELLRQKSFLAMHRLTDQQIMSDNMVQYAAEVFAVLKPFDDFLNASLE
jgi:uncharacterized protein (TIGR02453 family)